MQEEKFKRQIDQLYGNNPSYRRSVQEKCYGKKGFMNIAGYLMDSERVEALAPIADNPQGWNRTRSSFLQDWYIILTDKRMIFASPSLVLKEVTATSYRYSALTSVAASKWNSIKLTANGYVGFMNITGSYLYYEQRDELLRIIEKHMYC